MIKFISKKSQATVLIILAIVIVVSIALTYFSFYNKNSSIKSSDSSADKIYSFTESCLRETAIESLFYIGRTGGYTILPIESQDNEVAYYLYNNQNLMPKKEKIETEISSYVDTMFYFCLNDYSNFKDYNITFNEIKTKTSIESNKVVFNINFPISIKKGSHSYDYNNFFVELPIRLGIIYSSASQLMDKQMQNKEAICISCIHEIAENNSLDIQMSESSNNSIIFIIRDPNSKLENKDYEFYFVNKYNKPTQ